MPDLSPVETSPSDTSSADTSSGGQSPASARQASPQAIPVGIAIVRQENTYLVGTRLPGQVLAGMAEFPGGKCDPGESPADCAVRECLEETGLPVIAGELLLQTRHCYAHGTVDLFFHLCHPCRPETGPLLGTFRWVPVSDLPGLVFPEANAALIPLLTTNESRP